jgi:hypothetical protein
MTTHDLLIKYNKNTLDADMERPLWHLLKAHEKQIEGLIEEDPTGQWFHKAFRQIGVTNNKNIDMAIWLLLQDASVFWDTIHENS